MSDFWFSDPSKPQPMVDPERAYRPLTPSQLALEEWMGLLEALAFYLFAVLLVILAWQFWCWRQRGGLPLVEMTAFLIRTGRRLGRICAGCWHHFTSEVGKRLH